MVSQLTHKKEDLLALNVVSTDLTDDDDDDDDDDQGEEHYEDIKLEVCGAFFSIHYVWCLCNGCYSQNTRNGQLQTC
jgi:hypothetical protein